MNSFLMKEKQVSKSNDADKNAIFKTDERKKKLKLFEIKTRNDAIFIENFNVPDILVTIMLIYVKKKILYSLSRKK